MQTHPEQVNLRTRILLHAKHPIQPRTTWKGKIPKSINTEHNKLGLPENRTTTRPSPHHPRHNLVHGAVEALREALDYGVEVRRASRAMLSKS